MGQVELGPELDLLDDRLWIRPLAGAIEEPPASDGTDASRHARMRSRVVFDHDGEKMVITSDELFVTAGEDVVAKVREDMARRFEGAVLERTDVLGDGVEALRVVPATLDMSREEILIVGLYVIGRDRTMQWVAFYVNPRAARGGREACLGLALRSAQTLRAGDRSLTVGGSTSLQGVGARRLTLTLPEGTTVVTQPGPGFVIHSFYELAPIGADRVTAFVYFGRSPVNVENPTTSIEGRLFGRPIRFGRFDRDGVISYELMEDLGEVFTHTQLSSRTEGRLAPLAHALGEARIE